MTYRSILLMLTTALFSWLYIGFSVEPTIDGKSSSIIELVIGFGIGVSLTFPVVDFLENHSWREFRINFGRYGNRILEGLAVTATFGVLLCFMALKMSALSFLMAPATGFVAHILAIVGFGWPVFMVLKRGYPSRRQVS